MSSYLTVPLWSKLIFLSLRLLPDSILFILYKIHHLIISSLDEATWFLMENIKKSWRNMLGILQIMLSLI